MNDSEYTRSKLVENPLLRHLFNKLNLEVVVHFQNHKVRGFLRTIDISGKYIEVAEDNQVHFINMRECLEVITPVTDSSKSKDKHLQTM